MGEAMFIGLKNKAPDESMVCSLVRLLFKVQAKESEQHISINFTSLFSCTSKKKIPTVEVDCYEVKCSFMIKLTKGCLNECI